MAIWGAKDKTRCCNVAAGTPAAGVQAETAKADSGIQVLGAGCKKCQSLEAVVRAALAELGSDAHIDHVTDFARIAAYGVMTTPALVINGKVVSCGKVLKLDEAKALIAGAWGNGSCP